MPILNRLIFKNLSRNAFPERSFEKTNPHKLQTTALIIPQFLNFISSIFAQLSISEAQPMALSISIDASLKLLQVLFSLLLPSAYFAIHSNS